MKHTTINSIILATALSVAGVTHAIAAANESGATATTTEQSCVYKEDGRGKHYGDKKRGGKQNKRMGFHKLDLSAEQKQAMKDIMKSHKEAGKTLRTEHKAEMQALMDNPAFDEDKATSLIDQREAQRETKKLAMMKVKHEMYQLLTDEQKAKYNEIKEKREGKEKRNKGMKCKS